ncbi:3-deoxy-7-phosphoheptulonate synthase [Nostoc sp. FACHB-87]|uniref:3-deoxy-7-phosphoheptulonate synthase n=1 Tax=Nostocaceae TaxID=1162 RepID=UPI001686E1BE|nr:MULTISPECIES: 3-deoxy-7-phosphoheptulonate synthase [Nostocaceae]MBD2302975.1 3-deoxy-7-phosphoheptulonate synthase [Nostoc sp. FACHB-190]MBD2459014.1 3-deoxy-7-phosphoheptulonate synthase [Nostoc sp. FACHB-87]MBD2480167.1 3-deoxy-7-phosphoheptulonate synthase [Anabaena sp. FACHB-83]
MHNKLSNTNIKSSHILLTPHDVKTRLPITKSAEHTVLKYRQELENILDFQDSRKFIVVGPCSIHDTKAAIEYAEKLKVLADQVKDKLLLVMRVYFEKPRTTVGWKGLINDPDMDDSFHVEKGLLTARSLLLKITELELPAGTEALDPIIPQYISELITWSAIGARTTESQTHREMSSGLSMPVGFKNGTDGNIQVALNALHSAKSPHNFLGINNKGQVSVFQTMGNPYGHVILRGGNQPNYDAANVKLVEQKLKDSDLPPRIVIDCSHGNTNKDYRLQSQVFEDVIQQIIDGNTSIVGMMLESHLYEGNQPLNCKPEELKYGVSVTDKCIGWEETERIILAAHARLR